MEMFGRKGKREKKKGKRKNNIKTFIIVFLLFFLLVCLCFAFTVYMPPIPFSSMVTFNFFFHE